MLAPLWLFRPGGRMTGGGRLPVNCARFAFIACAVSGGVAVAQEEPSEDERREADCIDSFNDPLLDPNADSLAKNPIRLRVMARVGSAPAGKTRDAVPDGFLDGAKVDFESPVIPPLVSSGRTVLGPSFGLSATTQWVPGRSNGTEAGIRIGMKRRRWLPTWSTATDKCRLQRTDLGLDVLRWGLGSFKRHGGPAVLQSSVALPAIVLRREYSTWGLALNVAPFEFRLAPAFEFGGRGSLEYRFAYVVFEFEVGGHYAPDQSFYAALNAGIGFEIGGQ
jgi:hypothetical protein